MKIIVYPVNADPNAKGIEIYVISKTMIEHVLGGKIMLAKQEGEKSTLIAEKSVDSKLDNNAVFPQYKGVVIIAHQDWADLP